MLKLLAGIRRDVWSQFRQRQYPVLRSQHSEDSLLSTNYIALSEQLICKPLVFPYVRMGLTVS